MAIKLNNSDDATQFVESPIKVHTVEQSYGEDPLETIARWEEERGYPMATRVEKPSNGCYRSWMKSNN